MGTAIPPVTVEAIVLQLRAALKSAELGRGSSGLNYDGHRLSCGIKQIIADAAADAITASIPDTSDGSPS